MRCFLASILSAWLLPGIVFAGEEGTPDLLPEKPAPLSPEKLKELASRWVFPIGEEISYTIYWGIIPVGRVTVTTSWVEAGGRILLQIHTRALSNRVIDQIYKVDDNLTSLIDPETFLSVKFIKKMRQGRHEYDEEVVFDHKTLKAHWKSFRKKTEKTYDIAPDTRDLLCFLYWMRNQPPLKEDDTIKTRVDADEKIYDLTIQTFGLERVKTSKYGKQSGLKCIPKAEFNGLFVRKGDMTVWVSRDPRMVMLKLIADTPFANVEIFLNEVKGPGNDFWVVKKKK